MRRVCACLPVIELKTGETFPWPDGKTIPVSDRHVGEDRMLMLAQFSGDLIACQLRKADGQWKVDPGLMVARVATIMKLARG